MADSKDSKVTRIKASDSSTSSKEAKIVKAAIEKQPKKARNDRHPILKVLFSIGGYFKGAWFELRQVRWPTRKATWGLTLAVILFSAFFVVLILLLDLVFKYLFELILS